jgi:2-dehydro-3-deoxyphosphogluconate aldolase / (4S)-4-hydroxy-2-oxoglutarate aldolase
MKKSEVCEVIRNVGVVPAIRVASAEDAHFACEVVASGGIPIVEITMTVPEAVDLIGHLVKHHARIVVGAGSVVNSDMAARCVDAGAHFLTSPGLNLKVMDLAAKREIATLPGALTPTEVMKAWDAGSDFVKVFPCVDIGGARYIKALKTSLPEIPLIAAGGVTQQTATTFLLAGATAIGVGTELIPADAIANREAERIRELAHRFLGYVKEARSRIAVQNESSALGKTDFLRFHKPRKADKQ